MEKILFVHVCNKGQPKIKFISTGFIALANFMQKKGFDCKILNTCVEEELDKEFNLLDYIKKNNYKILCFSLQWHYQSKAVIDSIKEIKENLNDIKVILGGRTASFFAKEIMENFDFIDFIIKGHAEMPLLNLMNKIKDKESDFTDVANLFWREDKEIVMNETKYLPTKEIFSELSFNDNSLIIHKEEYEKTGLAKDDKENEWLTVYNCGMGCPVDCSFCSGSKTCQKFVNGVEKPIFIEIETIIKNLKEMSDKGKGVWYTSFDPYPNSDYYIKLFEDIKKQGIKLKCKFESWGLPTAEFIKKFKDVFEDGSEIVLSPETGSENVRKLNKGYFYTNKDLIKSLKNLEENKINAVLFFTTGLPYESKEDIVKTLSFVNFLRKRFANVKIVGVPIEIEPGSPMFMSSDKFKIIKNREKFMDYYNKTENKPELGYRTENLSSEEIIEAANLVNVEAKCRAGRSVFLKALTDTLFDQNYFDLKDIWNMCSVCKFFKECFKKDMS